MGQCLGRRSKDAQAGPGAGNKALERALLVGVSYLSQRAELCDSASDAAFLAEWLWTSEFAAQHHSVRLLAEDGKAHGLPTRHEILQGIKWLVSGAVEGSSLFFFFSGHGITPPYNPDGRCSLCPCDCATQGAITPADLAGAIGQLPAGVLLTLLIDIAHSGCPFRLPYSRTVEWTRAAERLVEVKTTGPGGEPESEDSEDGDSDPGETEMVSAGAQINVISCQCIHDADAPDSASAGAMTHAFAAAADVAMHPTGTADTDTLLRGIYSRLRSRRLDQVPRVQSTHDVRTLSLNPNPLAFWMQECRPEQPELAGGERRPAFRPGRGGWTQPRTSGSGRRPGAEATATSESRGSGPSRRRLGGSTGRRTAGCTTTSRRPGRRGGSRRPTST
eukprot:TRINITY_DN4626_c2_g1_i2.p1 TRINITY_DN4626_c2_g1~~TRINITY_DN4626_c2_g1_i2.p1  ORF type:complete len:390 (+),score=69.86 TRINITY_DN4626_c2_g1_i2:70-1239(+)